MILITSYFGEYSRCWWRWLMIWSLLMHRTAAVEDRSHLDGEDACPRGWISHHKSCYSFVSQRPGSWQDSLNICNASFSSAHLVSVNSLEEGVFLAKWLEENDFRRKSWWTSGYLINDRWEWAGDGSKISFYAKGARLTNNNSAARIAYAWRNDEFVWSATSPNAILPFICELPRSKVFSYYSETPEISCGLTGAEAIRYRHGPRISEEPADVITYANGPRHSVELPCKAESYPSPTYKWIKASTGQQVTPSDSGYVIVDGTLIIRNVSGKDFGTFFCEASNGAATVRSRSVSFSSSYVKEFPKSRLDVYGTESSGKSIPCEAPAHFPQSLSFAWMYDTVKNFLHESNRIFISSDGTLHFSYLTNSDQKNYACSVVIPELHTGYYGPFFTLKVDPTAQALPSSSPSSSKPVMADGFLQIYPNEPRLGAAAWIECFAYAKPAPVYRWIRVDHPLNPHVVVRNFGRRLFFPHLLMNDTGTYRCIAENRDGAASKDINLVLQISPKLMSPLPDVVVETGGTASFLCDVFGVPRLEYEWFHNGKPLNPLLMPQEDQGRISIDINKLTIEMVQHRDSGIYQCYAGNSVGQIGTSAELIVRNIQPTFSKQLSDRTVYAVSGSSARLPCRAESLPARKSSTWRHENSILSPRSGLRVLVNGDLIIDHVNFSQSGRYTCTVESDLGLDSTSLMLTVLPQLSVSVQAKPSGPSKDVSNIDCLVNWESDKYMDVARKWTFNCHDIELLDQFRLLNTSSHDSTSQRLTVPTGQYFDGALMCRADTVAGHASASIEIERKRLPMTPIKVTAHNVSVNGVHMSWEIPTARSSGPSNADVGGTSFKVEARLEGSDVWKHAQVVHPNDAVSHVGYLITGFLLPNRHYQFRVIAQNRIGRSAASLPTNFIRTLPGPPAKAVTNLRANVLVSGEILIQWQPLQKAEWGSDSVGYFVEWQFSNLSASNIVKSSVTLRKTDVDHYVIQDTDLKTCSRHEIHISAFNEYGRGPVVSTGTEAHVVAAPYSQLSNVSLKVLNGTSVSIHWNRLIASGDQPCQKWTGIKLFYWLRDEKRPNSPSKSFPSLKYAALNQTEITVSDLLPNTAYAFQAALFNVNGDGPRSPEVFCTTHIRGPKASPTSVSVGDDVVDGRMVAVVRWDEVDFKDARVLGYKIHLLKSPWTIPHVVKVEARNSVDWQPVIELGGLKAFQEYKLYVSAFTEGGDGPVSEPVYFYLGSQSRSWSLCSSTHLLCLCITTLALSWKHLRGA